MDDNKPTNPLLAVFDEAKVAQAKADELYDDAAGTFAELQLSRGVPSMLGKYLPLLKKYAPLVVAGGGGTVLTALTANDGAFSGLVSGFLSLLGVGPTV